MLLQWIHLNVSCLPTAVNSSPACPRWSKLLLTPCTWTSENVLWANLTVSQPFPGASSPTRYTRCWWRSQWSSASAEKGIDQGCNIHSSVCHSTSCCQYIPQLYPTPWSSQCELPWGMHQYWEEESRHWGILTPYSSSSLCTIPLLVTFRVARPPNALGYLSQTSARTPCWTRFLLRLITILHDLQDGSSVLGCWLANACKTH